MNHAEMKAALRSRTAIAVFRCSQSGRWWPEELKGRSGGTWPAAAITLFLGGGSAVWLRAGSQIAKPSSLRTVQYFYLIIMMALQIIRLAAEEFTGDEQRCWFNACGDRYKRYLVLTFLSIAAQLSGPAKPEKWCRLIPWLHFWSKRWLRFRKPLSQTHTVSAAAKLLFDPVPLCILKILGYYHRKVKRHRMAGYRHPAFTANSRCLTLRTIYWFKTNPEPTESGWHRQEEVRPAIRIFTLRATQATAAVNAKDETGAYCYGKPCGVICSLHIGADAAYTVSTSEMIKIRTGTIQR